jgi:hypothetical protein
VRRHAAAVVFAAATIAALTGCAGSFAPIDEAQVRACLQTGGNTTRDADALPALAPLAALRRSDGSGTPVVVGRAGRRALSRRPWAVLWFFDTGAKAQEAEQSGALRGVLRTSRRQNVVAVFGSGRDGFGRTPTAAQQRRLRSCQDKATRH